MKHNRRVLSAVSSVGKAIVEVGGAIQAITRPQGSNEALPSASDMSAATSKAIDIAVDTTKQILTLALSILALSMSFMKEVLGGLKGLSWQVLVEASWGALALSVLTGVTTLMAIAGSCERPPGGRVSIYSRNIRIPAAVQAISFILGLFLLGGTLMIHWIVETPLPTPIPGLSAK